MRALPSAFLAILALTSCSLTRFDVEPCRSTAECRATFGFGYTCGGDGLCALTPLDPRCAPLKIVGCGMPGMPDCPASGPWPSDLYANPAKRDRLVIATVIDGSEPAHVARANAVRMAVQEASEASLDIGGPRFGLLICTIEDGEAVPDSERRYDTLNRGDAMLRVVRYLDQTLEIPLVVGPPASGEVSAAFATTTRTLFITPSATSPTLTTLEPDPASDDAPGRVWRTAPSDVEQADTMAADLNARGVRDIAIIADDSTYENGLVGLLGERLMIGQEERFSTAGGVSGGLAMAIEAVADGGSSEVVFISSESRNAVSFLSAVAGDPRFTSRRFFLTDAAANKTLLDMAPTSPALRDRIRGTRASIDFTNSSAFQTLYRSDTIAPKAAEFDVNALSFTAHAFDAGWLAVYAVLWASLQEDAFDARALGRGLRKLSVGVATDVGRASWPDVVAAFRNGRSIDVRGASGALDYAPDTEERSEGGQSFEVWRFTADGAGFCAVASPGCP